MPHLKPYQILLLFLGVLLPLRMLGQIPKFLFSGDSNRAVSAGVHMAKKSDFQSRFMSGGSCQTPTYFIRLSHPLGQSIRLAEVQTLINRQFILAGTVSTSFGEEGMMVTMAESGQVSQSKLIRVDGFPTSITGMKISVSGEIFICGISYGPSGEYFVARINSGLGIDWLKTFTSTTFLHKVVLDLTEGGEILLAAHEGSWIQFHHLNQSGGLNWNQSWIPPGLTDLVSINQSGFQTVGISINSLEGGKKETHHLMADLNTGNYISSARIGDGSDVNQFLSESNTFNRQHIQTGIVETAPGQLRLYRHWVAQPDIIGDHFSYILPVALDWNSRISTDNSGHFMGVSVANQGKLFLFKQPLTNFSYPSPYREIQVPIGSSLAGIAASFSDGGYLVGLNTTGNNEILLIKTDSIGRLPGCGFTETTASFQENLQYPTRLSSQSLISFSLPDINGTFSSSDWVSDKTTDCDSLFCPPDPVQDTCLASFYQTYRSNSFEEFTLDYYRLNNGNHVTTTVSQDRILGNSSVITYGIKLFDPNGKYINGKKVFANGESGPIWLFEAGGDQLMMVNAHAITPAGFSFTLLDQDLNIVWTKSLQAFPGYNAGGSFTFGSMTRDDAGNFYICGNNVGFFEPARVLIYKISNTGDFQWAKLYEAGNQTFLISNITTTDGSVVVVVDGDQSGSITLSVDKSTGALQHVYRFQNHAAGSVYKRVFKREGNHLFYTTNNPDSRTLFCVFDTTGRPLRFKTVEGSEFNFSYAGTTKNNHLISRGLAYSSAQGYSEYMLRVDTLLNITMEKSYSRLHMAYPRGVSEDDAGNIYVSGMYLSGTVSGYYWDSYLIKTPPDGQQGTCLSQSNGIYLMPYISPITASSLITSDRQFTPINMNIEMEPDPDALRVSDLLCSSQPQCSTIVVDGPTTVCDLTSQFTYRATLNNACDLLPEWEYDTAFIEVNNRALDSITIQFKKTGETWLVGTINAGCREIRDSVLINIQSNPSSLYLGPDAALCPGDSLVLHAGSGFSQYQWQDGSADSVFVARQPGTYFVSIENSCGNIGNDTLIISAAVVPPLSLGPDQRICLGDTLIAEANGGFVQYDWISPIPFVGSGPEVRMVPVQDFSLQLEAISPQGCKARDTLLVFIKSARPVNLGQDQSFCIGDSLVLHAGNGYQSYEWNTGQTGASLTVFQPGNYSVVAMEPNGCKAFDTLTIPSLFPLPSIDLGTDFNLCMGSSRILNPGSHSNYEWQDLSTSPTFTVQTPGTYWVTVTNNNNCRTTDTITLQTIYPLPANFLPVPDSICQYEKATIVPQASFSSYRWSTGSTQPTLITDIPGEYRLTVTDVNGCQGTDTTKVVQKFCQSGVFVPTAFTPNGDGINDGFRARVYGQYLQFRLTIYNRWGEKVFESTDPLQYWDGLWNGKNQDTGVFVWQCHYQLTGENPGYLKGTLLLIR